MTAGSPDKARQQRYASVSSLSALCKLGNSAGLNLKSKFEQKEQPMTTTTALFLAISFMNVLVFLFCRVVYRQERRDGRSHKVSLNESAVLSVFLLGSAVLEYVAVVAKYS
jgi:hypothetical protein